MIKLFGYLEKWSTLKLVLLCTFIVLSVGFADYITGDEIDLTIFYFLPISIVSWLGRPKLAFFFATTSAVERGIADSLAGHVYAHSSIPLWNSLAHFLIFFSVAYMVSRQRDLLDSVIRLSRTDALTGLANMRHLVDYANATFERARRNPFEITTVYLDLDNFKWVNDNLGHRVGDEVLVITADSLKSNVRSIDMASRIGGDEFVIFMPELTHEQAVETIERLRTKLIAAIEEHRWPVTVSIGVATYSTLPLSLEEMIARADELMYEAKRAGKNKIILRSLS